MTLVVSALRKTFAGFVAVSDTNFTLGPGKVLSLLGPSGCGKTTTLRMIAGFEMPTAGSIELGGRDITYLPARKRNIGMMFQSYALFPHLTAAENVVFGLEMRRVAKAERDQRVRRALDIVRMSEFGDRTPKSMSGGQQQLIALARALVIEPDLLLLDEPLSALDLKLREEMRDEIYRIVRELNITTVFVTHDQGEALVLSDLVAVMNAGQIEQFATPQELYRRPKTCFVADFIGGANVLKGKSDGRLFEIEPGFSLPLPATEAQAVAAAIRPEDIRMSDVVSQGALPMTITRARFMGGHVEYTVQSRAGATLTVRTDGHLIRNEGTTVGITIEPDQIIWLAQ
jgi:putative spermidine/putrescine transport system ATP-binding protein